MGVSSFRENQLEQWSTSGSHMGRALVMRIYSYIYNIYYTIYYIIYIYYAYNVHVMCVLANVTGTWDHSCSSCWFWATVVEDLIGRRLNPNPLARPQLFACNILGLNFQWKKFPDFLDTEFMFSAYILSFYCWNSNIRRYQCAYPLPSS